MCFDFLGTSISKSFLRVSVQQLAVIRTDRVMAEYSYQKTLCFWINIIWEPQRIIKDLMIHDIDVLVVKWWKTTEHFVK
jgi:hypothetical protein